MCKMYGIIEGLCTERGIKPGRMCSDLGISRGVMGDLKAGRTKRLSAANIEKISNYFGVSSDYLLGTEAEKNPAALSGSELDQQLEGINFALYGEVQELTDDQKRDVLRFIQFLKQQKD